jgi:hypothetical protein
MKRPDRNVAVREGIFAMKALAIAIPIAVCSVSNAACRPGQPACIRCRT